MKRNKAIFLFLALLLPILIFLFLKFFGKNEFAVPPLYTQTYPETLGPCAPVKTLPYRIADSVQTKLPFGNDSLVLVSFGTLSKEADNQMKRVKGVFEKDPVAYLHIDNDASPWKQCVFFLKPPFNLALVDRKGALRGQYEAADLDEMDRLITELTIILKKY
ncbi:hypothetical protein [Chryseolinea lacunae]|uniref:Thioredoxin domain-containing protein n=1 Tax=Chryseolinea lacunae TaxID=2801331 RepID=A0ABS1KK57_9BACT|nr:hypothetical protein [Chryseolinea lacunae]MBL0739745.1 hypothetical protein [Chryseolinea lacunae]